MYVRISKLVTTDASTCKSLSEKFSRAQRALFTLVEWFMKWEAVQLMFCGVGLPGIVQNN